MEPDNLKPTVVLYWKDTEVPGRPMLQAVDLEIGGNLQAREHYDWHKGIHVQGFRRQEIDLADVVVARQVYESLTNCIMPSA